MTRRSLLERYVHVLLALVLTITVLVHGRDLLLLLFASGLLTFLMLLNRKGRLGALLAVCDAYDATLQQAFGKTEVDVYTVDGAAPSPESQQVMRERIKAATGKDPIFHFYADPHMVGGVKFRIGDQLVDGSVATRLRRMRSALIDRGGARVRAASKDFLS